MKTSLSFLCGVVLMLGFNALHGASPSHHVYELRMYHVNEGKTEALQTRFRDHTDAIFKRDTVGNRGKDKAHQCPPRKEVPACARLP